MGEEEHCRATGALHLIDYADFAKRVNDDCVIFALACGKYPFNKLAFGKIAGLLA